MFIASTRPHTCISSGCQGYRLVLRRLHVASYTYGCEMRWRHESAVTVTRSRHESAVTVTRSHGILRRLRHIHVKTCDMYDTKCDKPVYCIQLLEVRFHVWLYKLAFDFASKHVRNVVRVIKLPWTSSVFILGVQTVLNVQCLDSRGKQRTESPVSLLCVFTVCWTSCVFTLGVHNLLYIQCLDSRGTNCTERQVSWL